MVYLQAYRHNLKVLQEFDPDNFPLEKYIVEVNNVISPPSYLTNDMVYRISNGFSKYHPEQKTSSVKILDTTQWPSQKALNLDDSQYEAYRAALTKQMVIIQGPPGKIDFHAICIRQLTLNSLHTHHTGTGKTYIGLRIVQTLLENRSEWPILIVCYTNHALDQFLEGIQKLCKPNELIRIGGKSQSEAMNKCNLSYKKSKRSNETQEFSPFLRNSRADNTKQLMRIQSKIARHEHSIEHLHDDVLGEELAETIRKCNPHHCPQLEYFSAGRSLRDGILNWLEYGVNMQLDKYDNYAYSYDRVDDTDYYDSAQRVIFEPEMDEEEIKAMEYSRMIDVSSDEEEEVREVVHGANVTNQRARQQFPMERNSVMQHFKYEIRVPESMSQLQAAATEDMRTFHPNDRWNLYRLWVKLYSEDLEEEIKVLRDAYRDEHHKSNILRHQEDIEIVKRAKIIGMTTTGAAKYRHIIDGTKPKITSKLKIILF